MTATPGPASGGRVLRAAAVLFDMDGVLVDSRAVVERTWRRWAGRHGLDAEPILRIAHGRRTRETLAMVAPDLVRDAEVDWLDSAELLDLEGVTAIPGAASLLAALPRDRWAVVTSAGRELAELRLGAAGLPIPGVLVPSELVTRGKPAPDGYLAGAERLGRPPGRLVVIEDAPPGVTAARAAGMRVIGLTTTHPAGELGTVDLLLPDLTPLSVHFDGDELLLRAAAED